MGRLIEVPVAALLLVLALPFLLAAIPIVLLTSRGPAIIAQPRVGRGGISFRCRKLRTMHVATALLPTHQVANKAITPCGRLLRAAKIDELPQLWNVLTGDMSLVGPRPCLPMQGELIHRRKRLGVYDLRPGITGLAQVRGIDMSDPLVCAQADAEYLRRRSVMLDLRILAATLPAMMPAAGPKRLAENHRLHRRARKCRTTGMSRP